MRIQEEFIIDDDDAGQRLDVFLAGAWAGEYSRSQIKKWFDEGGVRVGEKEAKPHTLLKSGERVCLDVEVIEAALAVPEAIPLEIVYEDADLLVVNKPAGLVVHPGAGNAAHTLVNALVHHTQNQLSEGSHPARPGIVHRLDKDTSGLLVVAKDNWIHERLAEEFKEHTIERRYWVVVQGVVEHDELLCDEPLGRSHVHRTQIIVEPVSGKPSVSYFFVKERFRNATLLEAKLETGRTHQIRVHLKHMGYPVLGDLDYGIASPLITRQALHAKTLGFQHPRTGEVLRFDSELPGDFSALLDHLRTQAKD